MPVARIFWIMLLAVLVAGCTNTPDYHAIEPDLSLLAPAEQALAEAHDAHVEQFAPQALDAARRRVSLARDIIYLAARQGRELNDAEHERVTSLVQSARLDARLALVKTQASAVGVKLKQLQRALGNQRSQQPKTAVNGESS